MTPLTLRLVHASFVCLALGIALGAVFALDRALGAALRLLHAELNLWGCVTLLIYGMAYHMLPRFIGRPLHSSRAAVAQSLLAILGVALAVAGWTATALGAPAALPLRALGALFQLAAAVAFVWLVSGLLVPRRPTL